MLPATSDSNYAAILVKEISSTIFLHLIPDPDSLTQWIAFFALTIMTLSVLHRDGLNG